MICTMPECQTTAGCFCRRSGIIGDIPYVPSFVPSLADDYYNKVIAQKDAELERMRRELGDVRDNLAEAEKDTHYWRVEYDKERAKNREMHRRAQIAEGVFESVKLDLEQWRTVTNRRANASAWLFEYALLHMERRIRRATAALAARQAQGGEE